MREILFRGKRIDNGEWVCGYLFVDGDSYFIQTHETRTDDMGEITILITVTNRISPETVGQFTGLLDKNGNKIFEGDKFIGKYNGKYYQIVFKNGSFCGEHMGSNKPAPLGWEYNEDLDDLSEDDWYSRDIEITGTIHDK